MRNITGSYEGEILQMQEKITKDQKSLIRYVCLVHFAEGPKVIANVRQSSALGGIADYWRRRLLATMDDSDSTEAVNGSDQPGLNATVGERVIITFLNGSISNPIITGYLQHENQGAEATLDGDDPEINAVFQYLGNRAEFNAKGEFRFIHKGLPTISHVEQGTFAAAGPLLTTSEIKGNGSPAIEPAPETEITLFEFLEEGIFRIRDQEGQMIEIDRTKKRIYISNNDLKSTEATASSGGNQLSTNSTDAEYVLLDKDKEMVLINARKIAQIYSADERKDVTEGDASHKIGGDMLTTVAGDETKKVSGQITSTVQKDWEVSVNGKTTIASKGGVELDGGGANLKLSGGNNSIEAKGGIKLDGGGAKLKLSGGKVGLGGPAAELLDLIDQQLGAIINNAPTFVSTAVGPGVLNPAVVATLNQVKTLLGLIKGGI